MALAGIGTALGVIFIALSYYLSVMTLTFTVLTAVGVMCPLSKDYYREGILCAIVTGIIGFFIANVKIVPYAMVSGLYVVLTVFLYNKKVNVVFTTIIKIAYSCLVFWIVYKLIGVISINVQKITFLASLNETGLYLVINVVFSLCFIAYDLMLINGYKYSKSLAERVIKKS